MMDGRRNTTLDTPTFSFFQKKKKKKVILRFVVVEDLELQARRVLKAVMTGQTSRPQISRQT
jgi:hypothetical protein